MTQDNDLPQAPYLAGGFTSYSLNFEDVMLHRLFSGHGPGFYVDVGAGHPLWDNDTQALYESGWHGINVEPNEAFFQALQQQRSRDKNLCMVLSDVGAGELTYYEVPGTGLSTCDLTLARAHELRGHKLRVHRVPVSTLAHVLGDARVTSLDLLKIDVEGMEERVLAGNDWDRFRPRVILVEATLPESPQRSVTNVRPFLENRGYRHAYFDGLNDFYLEQGFDDRGAFALPPNVFDGFTMGQIVHLRAAVKALELELDRLKADNLRLKLNLDDHRAQSRRLQSAGEQMHDESLTLAQTIDSIARQHNTAIDELRRQADNRLNDALAEAERNHQRQMDAVYSSSSWRLTRPLRAVRRLLSR